MALLSVVILFARRPDQFFHPYIWVEDGGHVLVPYIERGLRSILEPVQGYHILISKIIALASAKLSILLMPELELVFTVAFSAAVVIAVALSPTHLPWPFACALFVLLVPTDSEVFAVSLLAIWWAGLLLLLALLWDPDRGKGWLRWLYIAVGGLSSPIIVPIAALMGLRALLERRRSEYVAAALAFLVAAVQLSTTVFNARLYGAQSGFPSPTTTIQKFYAFFFAGGMADSPLYWFIALCFSVLLGLAIWFNRHKLDRNFVLLILAYLLICAISVLRNPVEGLHPLRAGPRYFFYPYIMLGWMVLWVAAKSPSPLRYALAGVCCWTVISSGKALQRRHAPIDWKTQIVACAYSPKYTIPIHFAGELSFLWHIELTGEQCRQLLRDSIFRRYFVELPRGATK